MEVRKFFQKNSLSKLSKISDLELNEILNFVFDSDTKLSNTFVDLSTLNFEIKLPDFIDIEEKLKLNIPVAYITGKVEINGLTFLTPQGKVLIPRVETEELVEMIAFRENCRILDIGTGTGYIAINLKNKFHGAIVDAVEISSEASEIATENCKLNQVDVNIYNSDISDYKPNFKYDIIVSNPPYIPHTYKSKISRAVKDFEPDGALFAFQNGLEVYKKIADFCEKYLDEKGEIYLEIFSKKQGLEIIKLFEKLNLDAEIKKDIFGKYRFLILN